MNSAGILIDDANLSTKTVLVVGVKLDSRSRELLTWTLVKAAKPGDCVIALHVLPNSLAAGTSSLISLVKAFHSLLAVYEGLCTLKQVVLKLKVSRGDSVKTMLVKEVKAFAASKLILGISNAPQTFRCSSVSVAKYCAVQLALTCSVWVVDDWKIVFMSKAATNAIPVEADASLGEPDVLYVLFCSDLLASGISLGEKLKLQNHVRAGKDTCRRGEVNVIDKSMSNSLALMPYHGPLTGSPIFGWTFIRRMFVLDWPSHPKSNVKKPPRVEMALRLPNQYSSATVYSDKNQNKFANCEDKSCIAIGIGSGLAPLTPYINLSNLPKGLECLPQKYSSTCKLFSLLEILSATSNFVPENLVGQGGSSWVYRGRLPDGKEIAVKVLKPSENSIREFVSEIEITTNVYHKNIVKLLGFSLEANYLLLVYDYLPRGSLDETLHGKKKDVSSFGWNERFRVCVGVAQALTYLHGSTEGVIHRDVKSSNILLSDDFEPRLSDFGLAQRGCTSVSDIVCTDMAGTFGYLAPEYFMHGKITDKIDVYAFGVVLLELLSGRKPISSDCRKGQESLVIWAKPKLENGKLYDLLDSSLRLDIGCNGIERMVLAARLCIRRSPKSRPQMSTILKLLQGDTEVSKWAKQLTLMSEGHDQYMEDDLGVPSDIQSHLNLALLDLEVNNDALSVNGTKRNVSLQEYFQGRDPPALASSLASFDF